MYTHNALYRILIIVVLVMLLLPAVSLSESLAAATTGWRSPSANLATSGGDGDGFENNPENAYSDDDNYAENRDNGTVDNLTDRHIYYNYGFNIPPGSTIRGIEVQLDWWLDDKTQDENSMSVDLSWNGGTSWTGTRKDTRQTKKEHTYILGGASDTWGRTWSVSNFSDANFRVRVHCYSNTGDSRDFFLDWVAVQVTYESSLPPGHNIYLPLVMKGYLDCSPENYEPNNWCEQAFGFSFAGQTLQSYISSCDLATYKKSDYFYIDISTLNTINIYLTNIPTGTDYDLYLYRNPGDDPNNPAAMSVGTGISETISYVPSAIGRYYIRVYSYSRSSTSPYSLRVTYN